MAKGVARDPRVDGRRKQRRGTRDDGSGQGEFFLISGPEQGAALLGGPFRTLDDAERAAEQLNTMEDTEYMVLSRHGTISVARHAKFTPGSE